MSKSKSKSNNRIIYDWVTITSRCCGVNDFIEVLGLDNPSIEWVECHGRHGYTSSMRFGNINIYYNGHRDDMGVCLDMSGSGCRAFEEYGNGDYEQLFQLVRDEPEDTRITRLDVAYDDFDGKLDLPTIEKSMWDEHFVGNFRKDKFNIQHGPEGYTIEIGSKKSATFLRIYDKKQEQKRDDVLHWVRFELQLRADNAKRFILDSIATIGHKFFAYVNKYIRFVKPSEDTNKRRWDMADWWLAFIEHFEKICSVSRGERPCTMYQISKYIFEQAGNSIDTFIEVFGLSKFIDELNNRNSSLKPRHVALINEYSASSGVLQ